MKTVLLSSFIENQLIDEGHRCRLTVGGGLLVIYITLSQYLAMLINIRDI